jgi:ankyrin repeat protein
MSHRFQPAAALALAFGLIFASLTGTQGQSEPRLAPERIKELYFDAARAGRIDLLDGLIKAGLDPDARDPRGFTPLILAAYNGQAETAAC